MEEDERQGRFYSNGYNLTSDDIEIILEYKRLSFEGKNAVRFLIQSEKEKTKCKSIGATKTSSG